MLFELASPIGAFENSPAIYRREKNDKMFFVPSGRLNQGNQASLQDAMDFSQAFQALKCLAIFKCPFRTLKAFNRSIRDCFELLSARLGVDPAIASASISPLRGTSPGGWISVFTGSSSRLIVKSRDYDELPSGGLAIVSPHPGDRLVMVPGGENLLKLRAIPEQPLPEVIWLIDGREFARTPPPYETFWDMTRGSHSIMVVGPCDEASQIEITVE